MKIFFTASYYGKKNYQKEYDLVLNALENQNAKVISPEKANYLSLLTAQEKKAYSTPEMQHYFAIRKGIQAADAVVLEVSYQDFQVGFEAAYAVESKKYVLALSINQNYGQYLHHPLFHGAQYTQFTLDNQIEGFLHQVQQNQFPERFNFFLSSSQLTFLEEKAQQNGLNKSEFVRHLINKEMNRE